MMNALKVKSVVLFDCFPLYFEMTNMDYPVQAEYSSLAVQMSRAEIVTQLFCPMELKFKGNNSFCCKFENCSYLVLETYIRRQILQYCGYLTS